jgi:hypothetical protein
LDSPSLSLNLAKIRINLEYKKVKIRPRIYPPANKNNAKIMRAMTLRVMETSTYGMNIGKSRLPTITPIKNEKDENENVEKLFFLKNIVTQNKANIERKVNTDDHT